MPASAILTGCHSCLTPSHIATVYHPQVLLPCRQASVDSLPRVVVDDVYAAVESSKVRAEVH
jgi:hypothetical protein